MLTATIQGHGLGNLGLEDLTPGQQAKIPEYVGVGQQLKDAEDNCLAAYTNISMLVSTVGDQSTVPRKLLSEYNMAVEMLKTGAQDWVDAQERAGQYATPTYPPQFVDVGTGMSGFGAAGDIPVSQIRVVYGPQGAEKSMALGDPRAPGLVGASGAGNGGLGNPLLVAIVFVGIGFVVGMLALLVWAFRQAAVETARARANEAREHAKAVKLATDALVKLYTACIGDSTDQVHKLKCMDGARKGVQSTIESLPKTRGVGTGGFGFFGTIGLIVFLSGVTYGGYRLYQHRQATKATRSAGRMAGYRRYRRRRR